MKKIISVLLILVFIAAIAFLVYLFFKSQDVTMQVSEGLAYQLNEEEDAYICTGLGSFKGENLVIPSTYNGLPVTDIASNAFEGCESIVNVVIPYGVTTIGARAFKDCANLLSVEIPLSVVSMGTCQFQGCDKVTIYCEASDSQDVSWDIQWNVDNRPVKWGHNNFVHSGTFKYVVHDNNAIIFDYLGKDEKIEIPSKIKSYNVVDFGITFRGNTDIVSVVIPHTVTLIRENAFYNCSKLSEVTFEEDSQLKIIESSAFCGSGVKEINIPHGVEKIDEDAFYNCKNLINITLPDTLKSIGHEAFYGTAYINNEANWEDNSIYIDTALVGFRIDFFDTIVVKEGTTIIADRVFSETGLRTVQFPDSLRYIGAWAFSYGCLESVNIPANVESIGKAAFTLSPYLSSINVDKSNQFYRSVDNCLVELSSKSVILGGKNSVIPSDSDINSIGYQAFAESQIASVYIPANITKIEDRCFYNCNQLTELTISENVQDLGDETFMSAHSLASIVFEEGSKLQYIGEYTFYECRSLQEITVPVSVQSIEYRAFYGCDLLTDLRFEQGSQLEIIGNSAFDNCVSLKNIQFNNVKQLQTIEAYAFRNCQSLEEVVFASDGQLTILYTGLFDDCVNLTSVTIPNTVKKISSIFNKNCSNLATLTVPFIYSAEDTEFNYIGYYFGASSNIENADYVPASLKTVEITGNIESLSKLAFYECPDIETIILSGNITSIASRTFEGCSSLSTVELPDSLKNIDASAFSGCGKLSALDLPESLEQIGANAFSNSGIYNNEANWQDNMLVWDNCLLAVKSPVPTDITIKDGVRLIANEVFSEKVFDSVTIPASVVYIGKMAFYQCGYLSYLIFEEGSQLRRIGNLAFYDCLFEQLTIPASVEVIGESAFYSCGALRELNFEQGSKLTGISIRLFGDCYNLEKVEIPSSVKIIEALAFSGCENLSSVTFEENSQLTTIEEQVFTWSLLTSITIPASVSSIDPAAFNYCELLEEVVVEEGNAFYSSQGNCLIEKNSKKLILGLNSSVIPDDSSVEIIGASAFNLATKREEIVIPKSIKVIEDYAFYMCSSLEKITFAENGALTTIGEGAFAECGRLKVVVLPEGLTTIGSEAFSKCDSLVSITIPKGVTQMGYRAFWGSSNAIIYCKDEEKPEEWRYDWNDELKVYWGVK